MTRILHLSDPHLARPGHAVFDRLDTAALLRAAVARITAQRDGIDPLDALLVTGDISEDGSAESYALFRDIVAPLGLPLLAIPGNHDDRTAFRAAFSDTGLLPRDGWLDWSHDIGDLRIIGLDTLVEGQASGALRPESLTHLETALADAPGAVLVALHHPPFACGIPAMDAIGLTEGRDALARCVAAHPGPVRVLSGHIHNAMVGEVGGRTAITAPSICSTFDQDFRAGLPIGLMTAPGGAMVHDWDDGAFRCVTLPPERGEGPFPIG